MHYENTPPFFLPSIDESDKKAVSIACQELYQKKNTDEVEQFEEAIANYCGCQHAVAFNSATAAFMASTFAAEISPIDRLFISPIFPTHLIQNSANIHYIDLEKENGNLSLDSLQKKMKERYSRGKTVIIPVHSTGSPMAMEHLQETLIDPNAFVIEDASYALGSRYADGTRVGSSEYSDITIFRFEKEQLITADLGAAAVTNNAKVAEKLRSFQQYGAIKKPIQNSLSEKNPKCFSMTTLQAALGSSQLKRIDSFIARRFALFQIYWEILKDFNGITLVNGEPNDHTAYSRCLVQIDFAKFSINLEQLINELHKKAIAASIPYFPLHNDSPLQTCNSLPSYKQFCKSTIALPIYCDQAKGDIEKNTHKLQKTLASFQ